MRALALLALLPSLAFGQTAVKVFPVDTTQSGCSLGALNATCEVALAGKSSAGFVVTAVSSPVLTLVAETSRDGTNWDGRKMFDADTGFRFDAIVNGTIVVGYGRSVTLGTGDRRLRMRVSAYTSGSATVYVSATDTQPETAVVVETADGSTQPTAQNNGGLRAPLASPDGRLYVQQGGPARWTCSLNGIAATLTECKAAASAGLSHYVSWIWWQSTTTTAGTGSLQSGTGTNCGTGTTAVLPASGTANRYGYPASSTAASVLWFPVPIKLTTAHALCVIGVATNTVRVDIGGFTAP